MSRTICDLVQGSSASPHYGLPRFWVSTSCFGRGGDADLGFRVVVILPNTVKVLREDLQGLLQVVL